jgi:hypothetical protein
LGNRLGLPSQQGSGSLEETRKETLVIELVTPFGMMPFPLTYYIAMIVLGGVALLVAILTLVFTIKGTRKE